MDKLTQVLMNAMALTDDIVEEAIDTEDTKELIIKMNTQDQLYEKGILADGGYLPDYSPFTVEEKKMKGQRTDHMTLQDTGAMKETERVVFGGGEFKMTMNTVKDGEDLQERYRGYGEIVGLTSESMSKLQEHSKPKIIRKTKEWLLK